MEVLARAGAGAGVEPALVVGGLCEERQKQHS